MTESPRIYYRRTNDGFEKASFASLDDQMMWGEMRGRPQGASWQPIVCELLTHDDRGQRLRTAYMPSSSAGLVLRDEAIDQVGGVLSEFGELLPLHCKSADLMLFNPLVVIDALDEENSKVFRLPSTNKVADAREPRFFREMIAADLVFMVPQLVAKGEIFFTASIVKRIEATGLSANVRFVAAKRS